jgi:hypothetical protein
VPVPPEAFTWIGRSPRVADLGGGLFVYRVGVETDRSPTR